MGAALLSLLLMQAAQEAPPQTPPPAQQEPQRPPPPDPNHKYDPITRNDPNDLHRRNPLESLPRMTIVHGRVASAAGGSLPAPASIEAICAGSHQQAIFAKDEFDIAISTSSSPITGGGSGACHLRVSLSGFQSVIVPVGMAGGLRQEVGLVILRPREGVTGFTYSATTLFAPPKARKAFEKGFALAGKSKWKEARKELETATSLYPKFAAAWCELGDVQNRLGFPAEARAAYQNALDADGKFLRPLLHMAILAAGQREWRESAMLTDRLIALNPHDYPEAFLYNAAALYNLGLAAPAEQAVLRAIELDPSHLFPKTYQLLATIQASRGERSQAAENLRLFLKHAPNSPDAAAVRRQLDELSGAR